jgi:hypothetical protein
MDFFKVYNIVQSASINDDVSSGMSSNISGNISNNSPQLHQIVLKPKQSAKKKIQHFRLLTRLKEKNGSIIEQYINNPFVDHDNSNKYAIFVEWDYHNQKIGEYEYYYLSAIVNSDVVTHDSDVVTHDSDVVTHDSDVVTHDSNNISKIYLTIVKKNNSSLYVFLEYPNTCYYIVSIILEKYLKNYWEIENF